MTLSTWQLIVVGALAAVWAVVLGVPLLADLLRWLRNRPSAPSDDRSTPERMRSAIGAGWQRRPRPLQAWRAQDVAERRLQVLMGVALATVVAMFLAIALRGLFVYLFGLMAGALLILVVAGVVIGSREHRRLVADHVRRQVAGNQSQVAGPLSDRSRPDRQKALVDGEVSGQKMDYEVDGVPTANPWQNPDGEFTIPTIAEISEAFRTPDRSGFMFPPLNLDEALDGISPGDVPAPESDIDVPVDPDLVAELELDLDALENPRFEAAPEVGPRQASARARRNKRRRARPIYIESALDEEEGQGRAMND